MTLKQSYVIKRKKDEHVAGKELYILLVREEKIKGVIKNRVKGRDLTQCGVTHCFVKTILKPFFLSG